MRLDGDEVIFVDEDISGFGREARRTPLPGRLEQMRRLGRDLAANGASEAAVFRREAELLADFEIDRPETVQAVWFSAYAPTYDMMSDAQLLAYFAWRTRLRREGAVAAAGPSGGIRAGVPSAFAFLHVQELLNGAGAASPEDAWARIHAFWTDVRAVEHALDECVPRWLNDLVVRDGLPPALRIGAAPFHPSGREDAEAGAERLLECLDLGEALFASTEALDGLWRILDARSAHHPLRGRFGSDHADALRRLAAGCLLRLRGEARPFLSGIVERLAGTWRPLRGRLFAGAVVDPAAGPGGGVRTVAPGERWVCTAGAWRHEVLVATRGTVEEVTQLLRLVENAVRSKAGARLLVVRDPTPDAALTALVGEEFRRIESEARQASNPARRLDFSRLGRIRGDAEAVRERLVVPGSEEDAAVMEAEEAPSVVSPVPAAAVPSAVPAAALVLSPDDARFSPEERTVLLGLLGDGRAELPAGQSPEGFADRVNALLLDEVGDAVLEVSAGRLTLVEDYREDLEAILSAAEG